MKSYDRLALLLRSHGVEVIFGLMGDANMHWLTRFQDDGGRFVPVVHEASSVTMADTYSQMSGRVGVATVTHGPGFTNTLTSLVEATRSRSQVLLVTGDPPSLSTHTQRMDLQTVCSAAGAGYVRAGPGSLAGDLNRAIQRIVAERRPMVFNAPLPALLGEEATQDEWTAPPNRRSATAPQTSEVDRALGLLVSGRRPLLVAGRGAVRSNARDALIGLAELVGSPLATTALAPGLFRNHPSNLSIFGSMSHEIASRAIAQSDCIVAFGASLNGHTTMRRELVRGKRVVHVDEDPGAIGFHTSVDEAVIADAKLAALAMSDALSEASYESNDSWLRGIRSDIATTKANPCRDKTAPGTVGLRTAITELVRILPTSRVIVSDVGRFVSGVWPHLDVADARDFTAVSGFGSIGLGLAGSIGAAVARNGDLTVALLGDGGFMMHASEFSTAVREKLPLLVVIFNDGAYGAEHHKLQMHGLNPSYALNQWPDFAALAKAMGGRAAAITSAEQFPGVRGLLSMREGPVLLDIRIDPDQQFNY